MSIPATMRALQQSSLGGPKDLRLVPEVPVPTPGPGEVLIRVGAAGVNFVDISQSQGVFAGGPQPPYLAGIEAAGEVVALGEGVSGVELGAHVIGVTIMGGAFAEYAVLMAAGIAPLPPGWTDEQALGMVVSWPTALAALKPLGQLEAGQTVLIHAAAGGTGQVAVRLAKHYGATVIAAASPQKHEAVKELGADHVLGSSSSDLAAEVLQLTGGTGVDLVLESAGGATFQASLAATKRITGRVVVFGLAGGEASITNWDLVYKHQVHLIGLNIGILIQSAPDIFGQVMGEMFGLIASGVLGPSAPAVRDLADGPPSTPGSRSAHYRRQTCAHSLGISLGVTPGRVRCVIPLRTKNAPLAPEGRRRLVERCRTRPIAHVAGRDGDLPGDRIKMAEPPQEVRQPRTRRSVLRPGVNRLRRRDRLSLESSLCGASTSGRRPESRSSSTRTVPR